MLKTVCQSVAWFKRYKTLKSVTVGRSGRSTWENSHIQRKLARPSASLVITITSKTPDVAIDERGLVRNVHLFVCVHNAVKCYIVY